MRTLLSWVAAGLAGFLLMFFLGAGIEEELEAFDAEWAP